MATDDRFSVAFGARLRTLRTDRDLSLADLAERCGLQRAYIWRVEDGRTLPNMKSAARLASGLRITLAELVDGLDEFI